MFNLAKLTRESLHVIGMIHVSALPGAPLNSNSINKIIEQAKDECSVYIKSKVNGILVENMHDVPYQQANQIGPEITAFMTRICSEIRRMTPPNIYCGVQILAGCNKEALAVALASDFQFIRAEGYVFCHIADEGWTNSCAANLQRFRKIIGASHISIFTDIKKKHSSHTVTSDISVEETAEAARLFLSDGIILTGSSTGKPADFHELSRVKASCSSLPVIIGSGVNVENINMFREANAVIVGSFFKDNGLWQNKLNKERIDALMSAVNLKRT